MPTYIKSGGGFDPANIASKLPRPLQWPAGAILGGLKSALGGDDPSAIVGASAMEFPNKVPALPAGHDLVEQVTEQIKKMGARGPSIEQLGESYGEPWSSYPVRKFGDKPENLITAGDIEPSSRAYYDRINADPEGEKWISKVHGWSRRYDHAQGKYVSPGEPDMSENALKALLRLLAD